MGSLADVRDMNGNCDSILADAMIGVSYFTNLSRIDANGTRGLLGPAAGQGHQYHGLCRSSRTAQKTDGHGGQSAELISRATGQPVIGAQLALHKPDGSFDGTVGITLDVHWFDYLLRDHPLPSGRGGRGVRPQRRGSGHQRPQGGGAPWPMRR